MSPLRKHPLQAHRASGTTASAPVEATSGFRMAQPGEQPTAQAALADPQADANQQEAASGAAIPSTRTSAAWTAAVFGIIFLVAVVIFIVENSQPVVIKFVGASGKLPLAAGLLAAALAGAIVVLLLGAARILQLRMLSKKRGKQLARQRS